MLSCPVFLRPTPHAAAQGKTGNRLHAYSYQKMLRESPVTAGKLMQN
jgi:hypothetical protein